MFDANRGYDGYSMSLRAVDAYFAGEMPLSKWTKAALTAAFLSSGAAPEVINVVTKVKAEILKDCFLYRSSWHHTSNRFNRTDFYSFDIDKAEAMTLQEAFDLLEESRKPKEKKPLQERRAVCTFLEWSGTRKHPTAKEYTRAGVIRGAWFFPDDPVSSSKKKTTSNGFRVEKYLD